MTSNYTQRKSSNLTTIDAIDADKSRRRQHSGGGMAEEMGLVKFRFADAERNRHG